MEWIKAQIHSIQQIAGGAPGAPGRDHTINSIYYKSWQPFGVEET